MEPIQRRAPTFEAQDPLGKVNIGKESEPRMTKISGVLSMQQRNQVVELIEEYRDCFAWH